MTFPILLLKFRGNAANPLGSQMFEDERNVAVQYLRNKNELSKDSQSYSDLELPELWRLLRDGGVPEGVNLETFFDRIEQRKDK